MSHIVGRHDAALLRLTPEPGRGVDQYELAKRVGCTRGYISMIERAALAKLRRRAPWLVAYLEGR